MRRPAILTLPKENPYAGFGSAEVSELWGRLHKGAADLDELVVVNDGIIDVTRFFRILSIVADPLHPANGWRSVVEQLTYNGRIYLRLAYEIPQDVKAYWEEHGHPPRQAWGFFSGLAGMASSTELAAAGQGDGVAPANSPGGNPYKGGTIRHRIFEMAGAFLPVEDLIAQIVRQRGITRKNAHNMIWDLAHPEANGGRSAAERRTRADGVAEIRFVRPAPARQQP